MSRVSEALPLSIMGELMDEVVDRGKIKRS
jgi:hypothetical protein